MYTIKNKIRYSTGKTTKHASCNTLFFQPKLNINKPGDQYEQEADTMADSVMRMPVNNQSFFSPKPLSISTLQRKCKDCEDEDKKMQRKETNSDLSVADASTENYIGSLNGKGRPLTQNERSFFEPRFGYDFSDVNIHSDANAEKSAQSVNALAYTAGNHVVFNHNQFAPESESGKKLLAHELTHVVQQKKLQSNIQRQDINEDNEEKQVAFIGTGSYT